MRRKRDDQLSVQMWYIIKTTIEVSKNCNLTSGCLMALWKGSPSSYSESQKAKTFAFKHTANRNQ
jgi:hypothetical protein